MSRPSTAVEIADEPRSVPGPTAGASSAYLRSRLVLVEARVRRLVARRRAGDPAPDDAFRGLYISEEEVDRLMAASSPDPAPPVDHEDRARVEAEADQAETRGEAVRLRRLAHRARLSALDLELLLVALAPDLDSRLERLYGYLNDDVTRRRATIGLGLELCGVAALSGVGQARFHPVRPLVRNRLVLIEDADRPFLTRSLRVPDRVTGHLLGDDAPEPTLIDVIRPAPAPQGGAERLAAVLGGGATLVYLRERPSGSGAAVAVAGLQRSGREALLADLDHLPRAEDPVAAAHLLGREALLRGAGLVVGPLEAVLERGVEVVRTLAGLARDVPVLLFGRAVWEPTWASDMPLVVDVWAATAEERAAQWRDSLGGDEPTGVDDVGRQFRLSTEQVAKAAAAARWDAALAGTSVAEEHLRRGARTQNGAGLERLARHVRPGVDWQDLVLAPPTAEGLRELLVRARHRDRVLDQWGMRPGGGRGRGVTALFVGDSGTGKTMSAEVVAGALGLDLYTVNLATVVDKYVGETEKNLERIFTEADGVNGVLFFDEADALFGRRSEVREANDRYANIEVAYLLQRMESFDGLAILSTNLRANVDEAFGRRLDLVVDFPLPDADLRRLLWERCLGTAVPRADDVDLEFCAGSFELSGGNIRNIAVTAAYLAAEGERAVTMDDLITAVRREYRKLGRLVVAAEFGSYHPTGEGRGP